MLGFFRRKIAKVSDKELDDALTSADIEFIARYIDGGGNVNRVMNVLVSKMDEGCVYKEEATCLPLDRASDKSIRELLILHGALTYEEYQNKVVSSILKKLMK